MTSNFIILFSLSWKKSPKIRSYEKFIVLNVAREREPRLKKLLKLSLESNGEQSQKNQTQYGWTNAYYAILLDYLQSFPGNQFLWLYLSSELSCTSWDLARQNWKEPSYYLGEIGFKIINAIVTLKRRSSFEIVRISTETINIKTS